MALATRSGRGTVPAPGPGVRAYDPTSPSARVTHAQSGRSRRTTVAVSGALADWVSETVSQVAGLAPEYFVFGCLALGGLSGKRLVGQFQRRLIGAGCPRHPHTMRTL